MRPKVWVWGPGVKAHYGGLTNSTRSRKLCTTAMSGNPKPHEAVFLVIDYMSSCQNDGPFLGPKTIRHLIFRVPETDPNFDQLPKGV